MSKKVVVGAFSYSNFIRLLGASNAKSRRVRTEDLVEDTGGGENGERGKVLFLIDASRGSFVRK
jgi:hypothetical protein